MVDRKGENIVTQKKNKDQREKLHDKVKEEIVREMSLDNTYA